MNNETKKSNHEDTENRQIGTNFRMNHPEDVVLYEWVKRKLEKSAYSRSLYALSKAAEEVFGDRWQHYFYIWLDTCKQK